ncbi:hypothetical protein [Labrys wisconsinensis]|uniref:Uncharacterized protein n=1 Tax=Labrys wisconsinensis TaxID=425677 RepID=A0ABU0JDD8_9HYPH|nr:hypothetical protein [Labrys wisconsinensis]MDQ0472301.1 hypothetical protein [Labrys wisconsinensis]
MTSALKAILLSAAICGALAGPAYADCESDMLQLEDALKTPNLKPEAKAALDAATTKAVAAMKTDDDTTCHKAIAEGLAKAGIAMK